MNIIIDGIAGLNGTYDFNIDDGFTNAELRLIKLEAKVRAGELEDALEAGDNDVLVCFALIALRRAGRDVPPDVLWEAQTGCITLDFSDEEAEADASPPEIAPVSDESRNGHTESSLPHLSDIGDLSPEPTTQRPIGSPG